MIHCRGAVEIHISTRSTPAGRRFTIAHELGHLWSLHEGMGCGNFSQPEEEHFCNAFAAALLIPGDWLVANAGGQSECLSTLCRMARVAQAPVSAMLIRLRAKLGWRVTLLHYRRAGAAWQLASVIGGSVELRARLSAHPDTDMVLQSVPCRERIVRTPLPLGLDDAVICRDAELSVRRHSALALTCLRLPGPSSAAIPLMAAAMKFSP